MFGAWLLDVRRESENCASGRIAPPKHALRIVFRLSVRGA